MQQQSILYQHQYITATLAHDFTPHCKMVIYGLRDIPASYLSRVDFDSRGCKPRKWIKIHAHRGIPKSSNTQQEDQSSAKGGYIKNFFSSYVHVFVWQWTKTNKLFGPRMLSKYIEYMKKTSLSHGMTTVWGCPITAVTFSWQRAWSVIFQRLHSTISHEVSPSMLDFCYIFLLSHLKR